MIITVEPTNVGRFRAKHGDRVLVNSSRTPFLAAARVLASEGVDLDTPLTMRHKGSDCDALVSTVGKAASLSVDEGSGAPRFKPFVLWEGPAQD